MMRCGRIGAVVNEARKAGAEFRRSPSDRHRALGAVVLLLLGTLALLVPNAGADLAEDGMQAALAGGLSPAPGHSSSLRIAPRERAHSALSAPAGPIIGTNDGVGWGPEAARTILQGHITWNRVELGSLTNTLADSLSLGFKVLAIAGNVGDETPLSQINPGEWGAQVASELKASPGISIAEAGNESYLKGGVAEPVQYGRMYLSAVEDMKAAGIHTPLLFNLAGDYPLGSWSNPTGWSQDAGGGGWLRDAVNGVPGLAAAILANGVSIHPYGGVAENVHDDWGVASVAALESVAGAVLGAIPPFYVTEFGFDLRRCGSEIGACSKREQASKMRAAYEVFLSDPHIAGIWWYQSHDDHTGHFGFMSNKNVPRPAFKTLSAIAAAVGQ